MGALDADETLVADWEGERGLAAWASWGWLSVLASVVCTGAIVCGKVPGASSGKGVKWSTVSRLGGGVLEAGLVVGACMEIGGCPMAECFEDAQDRKLLQRRRPWWRVDWGIVGMV